MDEKWTSSRGTFTNAIRRQTFEEAAQAIEAKGLQFWVENAVVIRALAKEKQDG